MQKERYSIYETKAKLSEILRYVKRNRSVIITERGKDIARVVPMEAGSKFDARLRTLAQSGILEKTPSADPARIAPIAHRPGALKRFLDSRHRY